MKASMDNGLEISKDVIRKNTATIVEQADRIVHIIIHVRLFAHDADSAETSIVDLNDVACSGTSMLMAQFNSRGLFLEKDPSPHELPILVNPYSVGSADRYYERSRNWSFSRWSFAVRRIRLSFQAIFAWGNQRSDRENSGVSPADLIDNIDCICPGAEVFIPGSGEGAPVALPYCTFLKPIFSKIPYPFGRYCGHIFLNALSESKASCLRYTNLGR